MWTEAISQAPWANRGGAAATVFDGKMWLFGGSGIVTTPPVHSALYNDAWWSKDGVIWNQATSNAPWSSRYGLTVEVIPNNKNSQKRLAQTSSDEASSATSLESCITQKGTWTTGLDGEYKCIGNIQGTGGETTEPPMKAGEIEHIVKCPKPAYDGNDQIAYGPPGFDPSQAYYCKPGSVAGNPVSDRGLIALEKEGQVQTPSVSQEIANLQQGDRSIVAKNVKSTLDDLGYNASGLFTTKRYTQKLSRAISQFQADNQMEVTGQLDAGTQQRLLSGGSQFPQRIPGNVWQNILLPTGSTQTLSVLMFENGSPALQPGIIQVDNSSSTDDVLIQTIEVSAAGYGADIDIDGMTFFMSTNGAAIASVIDSLSLVETQGNIQYTGSIVGTGAYAEVTFSNLNLTLDDGDTLNFEIRADLNEASQYAEGTTISIGMSQVQSGGLDAENAMTGDSISARRMNLNVEPVSFELRTAGVFIEVTSASSSVYTGPNANDDIGSFVIKYDVTAFGNDVIVSDTPTATNAISLAGISATSYPVVWYDLTNASTNVSMVNSATSAVVNFLSNGSNVTDLGLYHGVKITEGSTGHFTLTIQHAANGLPIPAGLIKAALRGVSWALSDTPNQNMYSWNLANFPTQAVYID